MDNESKAFRSFFIGAQKFHIFQYNNFKKFNIKRKIVYSKKKLVLKKSVLWKQNKKFVFKQKKWVFKKKVYYKNKKK